MTGLVIVKIRDIFKPNGVSLMFHIRFAFCQLKIMKAIKLFWE